MYNVKVNGNYNLIIHDLGLQLDKYKSAVITQEQYDNSNELKKLSKYLTIEKLEDVKTEVTVETVDEEVKTSFIAREEITNNPEYVFVKENIIEETTNKKEDLVEEIIPEKEITVEENISKEETIVKEDTVVKKKQEANKKADKTQKKSNKNKMDLEVMDTNKSNKKSNKK